MISGGCTVRRARSQPVVQPAEQGGWQPAQTQVHVSTTRPAPTAQGGWHAVDTGRPQVTAATFSQPKSPELQRAQVSNRYPAVLASAPASATGPASTAAAAAAMPLPSATAQPAQAHGSAAAAGAVAAVARAPAEQRLVFAEQLQSMEEQRAALPKYRLHNTTATTTTATMGGTVGTAVAEPTSALVHSNAVSGLTSVPAPQVTVTREELAALDQSIEERLAQFLKPK